MVLFDDMLVDMHVGCVQRHMRNMWKKESDPTRCDQLRPRNANRNISAVPDPVVAVASIIDLVSLARRHPTDDDYREAYTIQETISYHTDRAINLVSLQDEWDR